MILYLAFMNSEEKAVRTIKRLKSENIVDFEIFIEAVDLLLNHYGIELVYDKTKEELQTILKVCGSIHLLELYIEAGKSVLVLDTSRNCTKTMEI